MGRAVRWIAGGFALVFSAITFVWQLIVWSRPVGPLEVSSLTIQASPTGPAIAATATPDGVGLVFVDPAAGTTPLALRYEREPTVVTREAGSVPQAAMIVDGDRAELVTRAGDSVVRLRADSARDRADVIAARGSGEARLVSSAQEDGLRASTAAPLQTDLALVAGSSGSRLRLATGEGSVEARVDGTPGARLLLSPAEGAPATSLVTTPQGSTLTLAGKPGAPPIELSSSEPYVSGLPDCQPAVLK